MFNVGIPTNAQLETMLSMQDKMNSKVNPNWINAGYNWTRAIMVESVELLDHCGWKWWKHQTPDIPQCQMEMIDIWHFALALELSSSDSIEILSEQLMQDLNNDIIHVMVVGMTTQDKIQEMVGDAARGIFVPILFQSIMADLELSWNELYKLYVGKNVLNFFRQDYGYKEGIYFKIWNGREDNLVLQEILASCDINSTNIQNEIYDQLRHKYQMIQNN